ncbi:MAG: hypothetical protein MUE50_12160, partial [Pirellulaceae bacterium]|nr:hypothetical protein [Pirellulaceae bacterium]
MAAEFDPYYEWLGIPPKDQPPNHYRLLGIELFEENRNVIDTAANRQMSFIKEYQAGQHSALTQKLLNELSAARLCLLDREKKAAYDRQLRVDLKANETPSKPPPIRRDSKPAGAPDDSPVPVASQPLRVPMAAPIAAEPVLPPLTVTGDPASDLENLVPLSSPVCLPSAGHAPVPSDAFGLPSQAKWILYGLAAGLACVVCVAGLAFFASSLFRRTGPPDRPLVESDPLSSPLAAKVVATLPKDTVPLEPAASPEALDQDAVDAETPSRDGSLQPPPLTLPAPLAAPPQSSGSDVQATMPDEPRDEPAIAVSLPQAEERLNAEAALASSAAAHATVSQQAWSLANQALLDSQADAAQRLATLALA